MASATLNTSPLQIFGRNSHLIMPLAVIGILLILVVPMPTPLLDLFISLNIVISIVVLLVAMYTREPVRFSVFPSLLLLVTLYRLALNVASTRLILLNGSEGEAAAGAVIRAFGQFVIGGNFVVGVVIFLVLLAIQFIVINHGAVRTSEVTARFTLDAMPGKQLAVDADLNAGAITEAEARQRRQDIQRDAEFHGAMDGAIRFTQRDAVASIIITVINIVGGFIIGVIQHNLSLTAALQTYTVLTVGDGLVTAVPSLLISVAGALITTRAAAEGSLGEDVSAQLLINPRPLAVAAGVLLLLALIPGLPKFPFFLLAGITGGLAYASQQRAAKEEQAVREREQQALAQAAPAPEKVEALLKVDTLALEVGYGLIQLVGGSEEFLNRVRAIRRQLAVELGIIIPSVHITDNLQLGPREYSILLKGAPVANSELMPESLLAIEPGAVRERLPGVATRERAFDLPAVWIKPADRERALSAGYTVVDPITALTTHLSEVIKAHAHELLGRQETRALLDNLAETHPKVVEEATPKVLSLGEVQRVLQALLRERVSIRDLATILETVADYGAVTHDVNILTEQARAALARIICRQYTNERGELMILTLAPELEYRLVNELTPTQGAPAAIEPEFGRSVLDRIATAVQTAMAGAQPVLLCAASLRPQLKRLTERFLPNLVVISHHEVAPNVTLIPVGVIE